MKVKDCMCEEICFVNPNANIYEVSKIMNSNNIGSVVVCDDDKKICGIVTDRDIVLRGIACDKNTKETQVKDIMSTNLCTCSNEDTLIDIEKKMGEHQIRRIPVCNQNNEPIGFISFGDIAKHSKELNSNEVTSTIEKICCNCNTDTKNNY